MGFESATLITPEGENHAVRVELDRTRGFGRISCVRFDKLPPGLEDALVRVRLHGGQTIECRIIDGSELCAVVGDDA